ncbi:hypothetical protein B0H65DRAFT_234527 [Neurospora tetraspora]|uniref:Uncharacterized protein n=1 Tax=Neurospora tetraspora TaxID=94610 RepID=A0AAE0JDA0_9PEZI|nr:hypothetical protein B0H65DRAFT_234527 [Neurospora tetraspora]
MCIPYSLQPHSELAPCVMPRYRRSPGFPTFTVPLSPPACILCECFCHAMPFRLLCKSCWMAVNGWPEGWAWSAWLVVVFPRLPPDPAWLVTFLCFSLGSELRTVEGFHFLTREPGHHCNILARPDHGCKPPFNLAQWHCPTLRFELSQLAAKPGVARNWTGIWDLVLTGPLALC